MTKRDWAVLGCRILALYVFFEAAHQAANLITALLGLATGVQSPWYTARYTLSGYLLSYGLISAIFALTGWLLWRKAPSIARHAVPQEPPDALAPAGPSASTGRDQLMEVALTVLGTYLVATRGSQLVYYGLQEVSFQAGARWSPPNYEGFVSTIVVLAVGIWLMLQAGRTVSFVARFRPQGASRPPRPAPYGAISLVATAVIAVCLVVVAVVYYIWASRHYDPIPF